MISMDKRVLKSRIKIEIPQWLTKLKYLSGLRTSVEIETKLIFYIYGVSSDECSWDLLR